MYLVQPVRWAREARRGALSLRGKRLAPALCNQMTPPRPLADVRGGICREPGVGAHTHVSMSRSQIPFKEQSGNGISVEMGELVVSAVLGIRQRPLLSFQRGSQMREL